MDENHRCAFIIRSPIRLVARAGSDRGCRLSFCPSPPSPMTHPRRSLAHYPARTRHIASGRFAVVAERNSLDKSKRRPLDEAACLWQDITKYIRVSRAYRSPPNCRKPLAQPGGFHFSQYTIFIPRFQQFYVVWVCAAEESEQTRRVEEARRESARGRG
jgi:hypothetical protein